MKNTSTIVNESTKKKMGRPRSVSANGLAPAVALRLPPEILAEIDRMAADSGKKRSDVIRNLVIAAVAPPTKPARAPKPKKAAKSAAPKKTRPRKA